MGGSIWNLEEGEAQRWYALALLILKAENGDLNVESENGFFRMITHVEIDLFLESDFHLQIDCEIDLSSLFFIGVHFFIMDLH